MNYISTNEIINIFISYTLDQLQSNIEVPRVDFIFDKNGKEYISDNLINKNNINILDKRDEKSYLIKVHNPRAFFSLLTDIVNESLDLCEYYNNRNIPQVEARSVLRRIWLRMNVSDFDNVESFLFNQLLFLKDRTLDSKDIIELANIGEYKLKFKTENQTNLYESTRKAMFRLSDNESYHDLSSILYDIKKEDGEKVCYISAVQKPMNSLRSKKIERSLYKINSLSPLHISSIHPNMSQALAIFLSILLDKGITHVKVPLYQVLSYDYHVLLSKKVKENFEFNWNDDILKYMDYLKSMNLNLEYEDLKKRYEFDKMWYDHLVNKEEQISYQKTENLANLFMFMSEIGICKIEGLPLDDTLYLDVTLNGEKIKVM